MRLKYLNELKLKIEENFKLLEKIKIRNERLYDVVRHSRDDMNEKDTRINISNRDIDRLKNINQEYLNNTDRLKNTN